jgi:O-antigen/teichoic acid export membrane protein
MLNQIRRLGGHSIVYGTGLIIQAVLAVLLLPLYTRYLTSSDYGALETVIAGISLLTVILGGAISDAFFRFYAQQSDTRSRLIVFRTTFWFTMAAATAGLLVGLAFGGLIAELLFGGPERADLVRAGAVGLWAQMNYAQIAALLRAEERSRQFVIASLANFVVSVCVTVVLVVALGKGPLGVVVGTFAGTLVVYLALLVLHREELGLEFDGSLLWAMHRFGLPLAVSSLAVWAVNFIDRFFLVTISGESETGIYSMAIRIASVAALALAAFQMAWQAFAYSFDSDDEAHAVFSYVLTYVLYLACWLALALGLLAPWLVRLLAPSDPSFWPAERAVALLAFSTAALAGYGVTSTATSRTGRTGFSWAITGAGAAVNVALNLALIPSYGMMGAAAATAAGFLCMFVLMTLYGHRIYPVPYQWGRVLIVAVVSVALTVVGRATGAPLAVAVALIACFPVVLVALRFYEPAEIHALRQLASSRR